LQVSIFEMTKMISAHLRELVFESRSVDRIDGMDELGFVA